MTNNSHNLGIVSKENPERPSERRRLPRLNLTAEQFRLKQNGKIFAVADLGTEGMALRVLDREDLRHFPIAAHIEGVLNLHREKHPVKAFIVHIKADLVGCRFEALVDGTRAALQRFLDPAVLGHDLKPIPSSDLATLWYHGPSGTDLFLWRGVDGQYRKLALCVLGSFVQWDVGAGISTGRAGASGERSEVRGIMRFETLMLEPDSRPDQGKLNIAKTLVLSSNLPQELKKWCVRQFDHSGENGDKGSKS